MEEVMDLGNQQRALQSGCG
ncbi:MAG: hypothetical protein RMY27_19535 [Nostoc sp. DedQUE09]|nr:hypothetical protein [Nostoc sp. DedQUE09]MDZ7953234.1 hypothetical protein [Nostoc sp. DedQUE09]